MLLKRGIRENSGRIEMSKTWLDSEPEICNGAVLGVWGRSPALTNFVFFCKNNLILGLF